MTMYFSDSSDACASSENSARNALTGTVTTMALMKNVRVPPEKHGMVAEVALLTMTADEKRSFVDLKRDGLAAAAKAVNRCLDMIAVDEIKLLLSHAEGYASRHDPVIAGIATTIVWEFAPDLTIRHGVRWPDLLDLVRGYYAKMPREHLNHE